MDWATMDWATMDWATMDWATMDWATMDWATMDWATRDWATMDWHEFSLFNWRGITPHDRHKRALNSEEIAPVVTKSFTRPGHCHRPG